MKEENSIAFRDLVRLLNAPNKAQYLIQFLKYAVQDLLPSIPTLYEEYKGFCDLCNARFFDAEEQCSHHSHDAFNDLPEVTIAAMFFESLTTNLMHPVDKDQYPLLNPEWYTFFTEVNEVFNPCMFCASHVSDNDPATFVQRETEYKFHYDCYIHNPLVPSILEDLSILKEENDTHIFDAPMGFLATDPEGIKVDTLEMFHSYFNKLYCFGFRYNNFAKQREFAIRFLYNQHALARGILVSDAVKQQLSDELSALVGMNHPQLSQKIYESSVTHEFNGVAIGIIEHCFLNRDFSTIVHIINDVTRDPMFLSANTLDGAGNCLSRERLNHPDWIAFTNAIFSAMRKQCDRYIIASENALSV
jgi:hypothetical protein